MRKADWGHVLNVVMIDTVKADVSKEDPTECLHLSTHTHTGACMSTGSCQGWK